MNIISASYNEFGGISVVIEDMPEGSSITVPPDPANKDYVDLQEWAAKEGNEILAYEAPPEAVKAGPTVEERLAALEAKLDARA